mmetsp:Transcript_78537/g.234075  ORF Transcript_78537/g.234075 Transcript_78537/m.234075 type:complete len:347 (-) Transcript_78537:107-1147(-)
MSDASVSSGHGAPATLQCLVTPKLTFNLLRKRDWKTVEDISQEELRAAFRSRFPVPLRLEDFTFRPAVPESTEISPETEQLVYKITAKDVADDRVMLRLLQELEKAYSERHKKSLEEAKAEMLASTVSFQVVVDELRQKHTTESDLVQRELGKLKTQLQQSQKRLFLLEQEKQQMGTSLKGLEADNRKLRQHVTNLLEENAALHIRTEALESTTKTLEAQPRSVEAEPAPQPRPSPSWVALNEEEERIAELERKNRAMAEQLEALGSWLKAGAKIFRAGERGPSGAPRTAGARTRPAATGAEEVLLPRPTAAEDVSLLEPVMTVGPASSEEDGSAPAPATSGEGEA